MRVEGYDYRLLLLRTMQAWPRTGCWVCDRLLPALDGFEVGGGRHRIEVELCSDASASTIDAHHLIPKQALKRAAPDGLTFVVDMENVRTGEPVTGWVPLERRSFLRAGREHMSLGALLMDVRNTVPVRRFHHDALEAGLLHGRPLDVPRRLLPPAVVEFAGQYGLERLLEAEYGQED